MTYKETKDHPLMNLKVGESATIYLVYQVTDKDSVLEYQITFAPEKKKGVVVLSEEKLRQILEIDANTPIFNKSLVTRKGPSTYELSNPPAIPENQNKTVREIVRSFNLYHICYNIRKI